MSTSRTFVGFTELKRAVSITQVLERYGLAEKLRRSGDSLSGACPIHDGHNDSQFRVSISKNCWICFGDCGQGGSIIDFVARKERIGIRDAALLIQDWFGIQSRDVSQAAPSGLRQACEVNGHVQRENQQSDSNAPLKFTLRNLDTSHPYLVERGLNKETVGTFGVGLCSAGLLAGWIAIPIHDVCGRLVAYAGRWPGEPPNGQRYKLPRGFRKSHELFNAHRASRVDARLPLLIVEGFFGCMKIWQAGYQRVVAVMGSTLSPAQEQLIVTVVGPRGRVILLFDQDDAGRSGSLNSHERLERSVSVDVLQCKGEQPDQLSDEALKELLFAQTV